jgi:hypothetical protein
MKPKTRIIFYIGDDLSYKNILFIPKTTPFTNLYNGQQQIQPNTLMQQDTLMQSDKQMQSLTNISARENITTGSFIIDYGSCAIDYILHAYYTTYTYLST